MPELQYSFYIVLGMYDFGIAMINIHNVQMLFVSSKKLYYAKSYVLFLLFRKKTKSNDQMIVVLNKKQ